MHNEAVKLVACVTVSWSRYKYPCQRIWLWVIAQTAASSWSSWKDRAVLSNPIFLIIRTGQITCHHITVLHLCKRVTAQTQKSQNDWNIGLRFHFTKEEYCGKLFMHVFTTKYALRYDTNSWIQTIYSAKTKTEKE